MAVHRLTVSPPLKGKLDFGVGVNWYDFLGSGGVYARFDRYPLTASVFPPMHDSESWDLLLAELTRLKPGSIRFGLPPDPVLSPDGSLKKDSVHFRHLDLAARWCERNGAVLVLDTFVTPERFEFPVPPALETPCINMAARDNRAYAREFVAPLLHHVVVERQLNAVRFFNPINEPIHYGVYQTPPGGPDVFRHYVEMYAEIRQALDAAGLTRVGLLGPDTDIPFDFPVFEYLARGIDIDPSIAGYSIHSYRGRFDYDGENPIGNETDPLGTIVDRWIKRLVGYAEGRGKYLVALEVGSFHYGWRAGDHSGPATAEATLLTAETILRMINVGVRGGLVWALTNPNNIDGWWRLLHVEDGRVERAPHPYSTYGMLMRYAPAGSTVCPLSPVEREYPAQYVWGTLLFGPDNHAYLLVINDHPSEPRQISVTLPAQLGGMVLRKVVKDRLRLGVVDPAAFGLPAVGDVTITDMLSPMSLQVYTSAGVENLI
jgi:hypothetical protein